MVHYTYNAKYADITWAYWNNKLYHHGTLDAQDETGGREEFQNQVKSEQHCMLSYSAEKAQCIRAKGSKTPAVNTFSYNYSPHTYLCKETYFFQDSNVLRQ